MSGTIRVNVISEIQNNTLRRCALIVSLPVFVLWNTVGAAINLVIIYARELVALALVVLVSPPLVWWQMHKPLVESLRLRWSTPKARP